MADYINREVTLKILTRIADCVSDSRRRAVTRCIREIASLAPANVEPVRHGRWVRPHWRNSSYCCDCSECGGEAMHREYQWNKKGIYPICPNCGSEMDLEDGTDD